MNDETQDNLFLYIDSQLVEKTHAKPYSCKVGYDLITIGCEIDTRSGSKEIKNMFIGEMTALYFLQATKEKISRMNNLLYSASKNNEDLIEHIKSDMDCIDVLRRAIIHVNPKYLIKNIRGGFKIDTAKRKDLILPLDHIKKLNRGVKIVHNRITREVFTNIGGIKTLLPMLPKLSEGRYTNDFV